MEERCRLCLNAAEGHIAATSIDDVRFNDKMKVVFSFPITIMNSYPSAVCSECTDMVEQFHNYHEQVKSNQDRLCAIHNRQYFEGVDVGSVVEYDGFEHTFDDPKVDVDCNMVEHLDDADGSHAGTTDPENYRFTVVSSEHMENEYDAEEQTEAQVENTSKVRKKVQSSSTRNSKEDTNQQKFKPTDETNRRLREFYDMKCEMCAQKFDSFTTLKIHYHQQHQVQGYVKCCGRKFSSRYRLLEHLSYHVGASMVRCEICNKNFSSRSYLLVHNSRMHGRAEDRPYKCTQCHQSYALECHLKAHMVSHVRVKCTICGKELSSSLTLRTHMTNLHGKRENHICESCGKEFRTRQAFDRHIKLHKNGGVNVVEQIQCVLCSKWLNSKRALKEHTKHVHTEAGQTFKCESCAHEFPNSRALSDHKLRVHVEERFECEICGRRFKRQIYLKEHTAMHTGKPLYSCDFCGATFNSKANKYSHRKNKHAIEWEARRKQHAASKRTLMLEDGEGLQCKYT